MKACAHVLEYQKNEFVLGDHVEESDNVWMPQGLQATHLREAVGLFTSGNLTIVLLHGILCPS